MKWLPTDCRPGDMIRISVGAIYHYGIFCSEDEVIEFGEAPVNSLFRDFAAIKVISVDIDEFACGKMVEVAQFDAKERRKRFPPKKTIDIARSKLGEGGYDLLHNNCEHFANECVFGVKRCSQEEEARERWKNRALFDIYIARIPDGLKIGKVYPKQRQKEIASAKNENVRRDKYYVWRLLEFALKESLGLDMNGLRFEKAENGKWSCDKCFFSLSHTDGYAAVAVSDKATGIDIENVAGFASRTGYEDLTGMADYAKIQLRSKETAYDDFLSAWTAKECAYKCCGKGGFAPEAPAAAQTETYEINGCIVSFCGDSSDLSIFWEWDGENGRKMIQAQQKNMTR